VVMERHGLPRVAVPLGPHDLVPGGGPQCVAVRGIVRPLADHSDVLGAVVSEITLVALRRKRSIAQEDDKYHSVFAARRACCTSETSPSAARRSRPIPSLPRNLANRQEFPPPPLSGFGEADILL